jgi:hypothetical protein
LPKSQEPVRGVWLTTVSRLDWPPLESVNGGITPNAASPCSSRR